VSNTSSATPFVSAGPMEGLEFTRLDVPDGLGLALEPTPGLEPTLVAAVPEMPGEPLLGWEATVVSPALAVAVAELPDLDRGRATVEAGPPAVPGPRRCRYCRNVQPKGLLCDRCGMSLPPVQSERTELPVATAGGRVRCPRCGERTPIEWERCGGCGALLPAAES
jgi:hypothetical protein